MKESKYLFLTILFILFGLASIDVYPQTVEKVKIFVDGEEFLGEYKVLFKYQEIEVEAVRTDKGFTVPDTLGDEKFVNFRIIFGDYDLAFPYQNISRLEKELYVQVDNRPFSDENEKALKDYLELSKDILPKDTKIDYVFSINYYYGMGVFSIGTKAKIVKPN
ncbi:MAG: hypothetical protein R2747_13315 [Pyrinomonadaceae bacterium]